MVNKWGEKSESIEANRITKRINEEKFLATGKNKTITLQQKKFEVFVFANVLLFSLFFFFSFVTQKGRNTFNSELKVWLRVRKTERKRKRMKRRTDCQITRINKNTVIQKRNFHRQCFTRETKQNDVKITTTREKNKKWVYHQERTQAKGRENKKKKWANSLLDNYQVEFVVAQKCKR